MEPTQAWTCNLGGNKNKLACARLGAESADARALGRFGARVGATLGFGFALLVLSDHVMNTAFDWWHLDEWHLARVTTDCNQSSHFCQKCPWNDAIAWAYSSSKFSKANVLRGTLSISSISIRSSNKSHFCLSFSDLRCFHPKGPK